MTYFMIFSCLLHFIIGGIQIKKATDEETYKDGIYVIIMGFLFGANMITACLLIFVGFVWLFSTGIEAMSKKLYTLKNKES